MCIVTVRLLRMLNEKTRKRKRLFQTTQSVTCSRARKESSGGIEKRVTLLFLTFLWTFLVCYTPAIVMMYLIKYHVKLDCVVRHVIRDLSFLFVVSNSAFSPLVCTIRLKPFNEAIKIILGFKVKSSNNSRTMQSSPCRQQHNNNNNNIIKNQQQKGSIELNLLWL